MAEQIASLSPSGDLDLIDIDLFPGGSIVAGYEYDVEPAYTKGLYLRTDRWLVGAKAVPGTSIGLTDDIDLSLSAGGRHQTEARFIRFMKDPCEAMFAKPYSPKRIPLKSKIALGPLFKKGDYFLFRGSVGFVTSAEILSLLGSSMWGIGLSGSYLMEGFYQLHIVRLDDQRVRLKIVGHRGRSIDASVGLGLEDEFEVFGVSIIDKQIERFVNTKPVKIKSTFNRSKIFMVDYVLDLTDPEVSSAFENVLRKVKDFRQIDLAGPFKKQKDIEASLLLDLSPLEDLYRNDYQASNVSRIKRNLRTTSEQNTYGFGLHVGNKLLGFKIDGGVATAKMGIRNPDDLLEKFLLRSWERSTESRFMYKWSRTRKEDGLRALFRTDAEFKELTPVNVVRHMRQRKNRFTYSDYERMFLMMRKALPVEIFKDIPWENWKQKPGEKYFNFGLRYEILMTPESILEAPELSPEEIKFFFRDFMKKKGLVPSDFITEVQHDGDTSSQEGSFNSSLHHMAARLSKALDKKRSLLERLEIITRLRMNLLFAQSGLGFLMSLEPEKMKKLYHLDLDISSNEAVIEYSFGEPEISDLYKKILTIKAALDDDALDLLREAESLSIIPAG